MICWLSIFSRQEGNTMKLETERLLLREMTENDLDDLK